MHCINCGSIIENESVFCPICGTRVAPDEAADSARAEYEQRRTRPSQSGEYRREKSYEDDYDPFDLEEGEELFNHRRQVRGDASRSCFNPQDILDSIQRHHNVVPKYAKDEDIFVDPDEKAISRIGAGWMLNYALFGRFTRMNLILTDRRCYLQGNMYEKQQNKLMQKRMERKVNVEDINATGFNYERVLGYLIMGIILAIIDFLFFFGDMSRGYEEGIIAFSACMIPSIILFVIYFCSKRTQFFIEYAGGYIQFPIAVSDYEQILLLDKDIHRVKDYRRGILRGDNNG